MISLKDNILNIRNGAIRELIYHKTHGRTFARWAKIKDLNDRVKSVQKDKTLVWNIKDEKFPVADHIEMSGFSASAIISYGLNSNGKLRLHRHVSFVNTRVKPNLTSSHFRYDFKDPLKMYLEDTPINFEKPQVVKIKGYLTIESDFMGGAKVIRTFIPSTNFDALIEKIEVVNLTKDNTKFYAKEKKNKRIIRDKRLIGGYIEVESKLVDFNGDFRSDKKITVEKLLVPNAQAVCYVVHYIKPVGTSLNFNAEGEFKERSRFIDFIFNKSINFQSEDTVTDAFFSHCLFRGNESIFKTKNGLIHSPGGGNFYSAMWANDQCEYANPFFPFSNYKTATEQAINCYKLFSKYILDGKCIPSSLVSAGVIPYGVAGDRGDTEMFLSGLTRFLLAYGNENLAKEFYPSIEKSIEFILGKKSADGVIFSSSDELENRFPSGRYNLSTNCLAYDGLIHASYLLKELGIDNGNITLEAKELKQSILNYFSGEVEGFDTYKYYKENNILRSWICLPSIVGIREASETTYNALFSDKMLINNTLKTASNSKTVWDRALLYALRGAFLSKNPQAQLLFNQYANKRLLGSHSPYPYEAYPEGNRAHLSAESVLFLRVVTEGIFGFDPISFKKLKIQPAMKAKLCGVVFNGVTFEVDSTEDLKIKISNKSYTANGNNIFNFETLNWEQTEVL